MKIYGRQNDVQLCTEPNVSNPQVIFFGVKYQKLLKVEIN